MKRKISNETPAEEASNPLLYPWEVAEMLCIQVATLRQWRKRRVNLTKCQQVGGHYRFRLKDVQDYLEANKRDFTV